MRLGAFFIQKLDEKGHPVFVKIKFPCSSTQQLVYLRYLNDTGSSTVTFDILDCSRNKTENTIFTPTLPARHIRLN